ncbi:MAG: SusC/RagA family TonB-linked outer membrane protein [Prevotella sp.]|nr:SusC/RagA family TonB-linked outer membrane protein [Prevotella sp.]
MKKIVVVFLLLFSVISSLYAQQRDTIVSVGYATGDVGSFTGSVKKLDERQMNNKDQATSALDAIRGRVAGMQVERNGTNALSAVRLRGTTSLTGSNDPLIIVDGVMGDLSLLSSVYPTDIESFTILKDASETSQYGSRGAAGVIEVKTLSGKSGKMRVNYNSSFGISSVYKTLKMMTADQYRNYGRQQHISFVDMNSDTDFQKLIQRTGLTQQHHLAFTGGTDLSNYRVALGYINNETVIKGRGDRSFMSNMNMTQMMFDGFLRVDIGMFSSIGKQRRIFDEQKLFYSAAAWNPTFPDHRNSSGGWDGYASASQINNPQALLEENDHTENSHISTHAKLTFNLLPSLKFTLFGAYSYDVDQQMQYLPTSVWNKGQAYRSTAKHENILANAILSYNKKVNVHAFGLTALAEIQKDTYRGYHTTVTNFSTDLLGYDNLAAGALRPWNGTGSLYEQPKMTSFMGRANYTLADKYIFSFTARADGSSKFGDNHKWGFFPAVSGAWVISKEPFMQAQDIINDLKLNMGYGLSGNQAGIDSYTTLSLVSPNGFIPANNGNIVSFTTLKNINPDLKWEVSKTFNIGLDAQFLHQRLLFSVNYYNTKVTDMLYPYSVSSPPFTYTTLIANMGSMRNSGLEFSIGGTPLVTKDMELTINGNISFQRNKLLSLSGEYNGNYLEIAKYSTIAKLNGAGFHGGNNDVTYQIVGEPLGMFFLPKASGLAGDDTNGYTYRVVDIDDDKVVDTTNDRYICGQAMPKMLIGSNVSFRYHDFDISMQVNGAFGHKIFNGTSLAYMNVTSFPLYNLLAEAPKANIKDQTVTDYWLENGDYVNIDYITLGWRVPLHKNRFVESMRLSLTMNNVATITGYSGLTPMINSSNVNSTLGLDDKYSYPLFHTYTIGLSLTF